MINNNLQNKVYIQTWGCQMNEYDSKQMTDLMASERDYQLVESPDEADCITRLKSRSAASSGVIELRSGGVPGAASVAGAAAGALPATGPAGRTIERPTTTMRMNMATPAIHHAR